MRLSRFSSRAWRAARARAGGRRRSGSPGEGASKTGEARGRDKLAVQVKRKATQPTASEVRRLAVGCGTAALIAGMGPSEIGFLPYPGGPCPCALLFRYNDAQQHSDHRGRVHRSVRRLGAGVLHAALRRHARSSPLQPVRVRPLGGVDSEGRRSRSQQAPR